MVDKTLRVIELSLICSCISQNDLVPITLGYGMKQTEKANGNPVAWKVLTKHVRAISMLIPVHRTEENPQNV